MVGNLRARWAAGSQWSVLFPQKPVFFKLIYISQTPLEPLGFPSLTLPPCLPSCRNTAIDLIFAFSLLEVAGLRHESTELYQNIIINSGTVVLL